MKTAIIYARAKADLSDFGLTSVKGQFQAADPFKIRNLDCVDFHTSLLNANCLLYYGNYSIFIIKIN